MEKCKKRSKLHLWKICTRSESSCDIEKFIDWMEKMEKEFHLPSSSMEQLIIWKPTRFCSKFCCTILVARPLHKVLKEIIFTITIIIKIFFKTGSEIDAQHSLQTHSMFQCSSSPIRHLSLKVLLLLVPLQPSPPLFSLPFSLLSSQTLSHPWQSFHPPSPP